MPVRNPSVLVFDVNETLLDITTLAPVFGRVFGDEAVLREWFAQLILYSEALTLSGLYTAFNDLAGGVLRMVGTTRGVPVADDDAAELAAAIATMPAHPDAAPALGRLREAGFRLVTLTNSPPSDPPTPLERAGLADFFERSFSVDTVRRFKPAPETYGLVAADLAVDMSELCLVACHLWDTIGAQAVGCRGVLVARPGNAVLPSDGVPVPDIVAGDMTDLVDRVLETWPRQSACEVQNDGSARL